MHGKHRDGVLLPTGLYSISNITSYTTPSIGREPLLKLLRPMQKIHILTGDARGTRLSHKKRIERRQVKRLKNASFEPPDATQWR